MKSLLRLTGFVLAVVLVFTACKKSVPKQVKYIPKDASFVIGINPKDLNDKLAKSNVNLDSLFKNAFADKTSNSDIQKWDDLKNSGVDFLSDVFAFVEIKGSIMSGSATTFGAVAALQDAGKFEAYLKKQEANISIQKGTGFSYAVLHGNSIIGWSDNIIIVTSKTNTAISQPQDNNSGSGDEGALKQQMADLFAQKEEASVAAIPEFRELTATKADAVLWTSSGNTLAAIPFVGMTKASDLFKDSYAAGYVTFEDGKVTATYKSYCNQQLSDILKKYAGPTVDLSMVEKYPTANLDGFALFSFNPQLVGEIIRFIGLDGTANSWLTSNFGFTLDDVTKAFKGDFAIVTSDIGEKEVTSPYNPSFKYKTTTAKYLFNAKVGDKVAYDKVTGALASKGALIATSSGFTVKLGGEVSVNIDEKNVLIASDSALLLQYKAGSGKTTIPGDVKDKVKGKAAGFYCDITKVLNAFSPSDSASQETHRLAVQSFKSVIATGDNFDGKNMKGNFELVTGNDKENSLATIIKFSAATARIEKQRQAQIQVQDSATFAVPNADTTIAH